MESQLVTWKNSHSWSEGEEAVKKTNKNLGRDRRNDIKTLTLKYDDTKRSSLVKGTKYPNIFQYGKRAKLDPLIQHKSKKSGLIF